MLRLSPPHLLPPRPELVPLVMTDCGSSAYIRIDVCPSTDRNTSGRKERLSKDCMPLAAHPSLAAGSAGAWADWPLEAVASLAPLSGGKRGPGACSIRSYSSVAAAVCCSKKLMQIAPALSPRRSLCGDLLKLVKRIRLWLRCRFGTELRAVDVEGGGGLSRIESSDRRAKEADCRMLWTMSMLLRAACFTMRLSGISELLSSGVMIMELDGAK